MFTKAKEFDDFIKNLRELTKAIRYEQHDGIHTYHICERCNLHMCRGTCVTCLKQELVDICLDYFNK